MTAKVKFTFILSSGARFENIVELTDEQYTTLIRTIKTAFRQGIDGEVTLNNCVVKLGECAVVDWEVLENE